MGTWFIIKTFLRMLDWLTLKIAFRLIRESINDWRFTSKVIRQYLAPDYAKTLEEALKESDEKRKANQRRLK